MNWPLNGAASSAGVKPGKKSNFGVFLATWCWLDPPRGQGPLRLKKPDCTCAIQNQKLKWEFGCLRPMHCFFCTKIRTTSTAINAGISVYPPTTGNLWTPPVHWARAFIRHGWETLFAHHAISCRHILSSFALPRWKGRKNCENQPKCQFWHFFGQKNCPKNRTIFWGGEILSNPPIKNDHPFIPTPPI